MFYDRFLELCAEKNVSPNKALVECGISRTAGMKWKKGAVPNGSNVQKLADYFGITTDYLLGNVNNPFFHLDNDRILREINSYDDENKKRPTPEGERHPDPDIYRIERAKARMPQSEWAKQMKVIEASFGDYFSDDYEDDDLDE